MYERLSIDDTCFLSNEFYRLMYAMFHVEVNVTEHTIRGNKARLQIGVTELQWEYVRPESTNTGIPKPGLFTIRADDRLAGGGTKQILNAYVGSAVSGFYAADNATATFGQLVVGNADQLSLDIRSLVDTLKLAETEVGQGRALGCETRIRQWFLDRQHRFDPSRLLP